MLAIQCLSAPHVTGLHQQAVAVLKGDSSVTGVISFSQESEGSPVTVSGDVSYTLLIKLVSQLTTIDQEPRR